MNGDIHDLRQNLFLTVPSVSLRNQTDRTKIFLRARIQYVSRELEQLYQEIEELLNQLSACR